MEVTVLCDVVENYGDIGVVYRLARALSEIDYDIKLNIVVNNLNSFSQMAPGINPSLAIQEYKGWTVLDWNDSNLCTEYFSKNHPRIILQCFQCIRPEWLEDLLFDKERKITKEIIHIVNVEYLTAEEWADGFHLLKSATRSEFVKKRNFMPGFTSKTGGLILDSEFMESLNNKDSAISKLVPFLDKIDINYLQDSTIQKIVLFTYQRDYQEIVKALNEAQDANKKEICVFTAPGLSFEPFTDALKESNSKIRLVKLPYLPQTAWDALLCCMDFAIIRGEDSFARACLCGIPFLWHAYKQDEEFQLVKVNALLKRMEPFFESNDFATIQSCMLNFNRRTEVALGKEAQEVLDSLNNKEIMQNTIPYKEYFCNIDKLKANFKNFSQMLIQNGNLAENLFNYMKQLQF